MALKCARAGGHGYRNSAIVVGVLTAVSSGIVTAIAPFPTGGGKTITVTAAVITGGISGLITGLIFYGAYRLITCNKL